MAGVINQLIVVALFRFVSLSCMLPAAAAAAETEFSDVRRERATRSQREIVFWRPESFPQGEEACGSRRLCDPDGILPGEKVNAISERIEMLEGREIVECSGVGSMQDMSLRSSPQMMIVVVYRMDMHHFRHVKDGEEKAAERFARHLHDGWGVGNELSCGGTGVLLFLSIQDRALFFSTGRAIKSALTWRRVDRIVQGMKPLLRLHDIEGALHYSIDRIEHYLQIGEPSQNEKRMDFLWGFFPLALFGSIIALFCLIGVGAQREQRVYAQVHSQLSELDRNRAEALQGRYQCTSCPICLEDFPPHDASAGDGATTTTTMAGRRGSDGLPLKLLRCGHIFDETCWTEWVNSGRGNVSRCPICQQDVGTTPGSGNVAGLTSSTTGGAQPTPLGAAAPRNNAQNLVVNQERAIRQYNRERNFRLARLGARFPRYVRPDQLQRWTSSTYDGSLVRDPSFVQSNPRYVRGTSSGTTGSNRSGPDRWSSSSFGGGRSAGGRGGSW